MPLYPLFADLAGREVLVVGGGEVALRKVEALLHAGARVRIHARELHPELALQVARGRLERLDGDFDPGWIETAWLVVVATDDARFNAGIAAEATVRRRLVNVVDDAALSSFQVPAVVERAPLQLAISSGGAAPMLARRLRERLETGLDPALGELAGLFAAHRELIRARQLDRADDIPHAGRASLVGSGPGDPGQLTMAALRAMNLADVLLVDAGVAPQVLALARKDAPRDTAPDDPRAAAACVRDHADAGRHVVWLRPGDGFRESPWNAVAAALADAPWPCEVLPGITTRP
jgi:precorrin-2 dehydrogenase/sirohydrochlorin ferrochelatase